MPSITIPHRFLFDSMFVSEVLSGRFNANGKPHLFFQLLQINSKTVGRKKKQNVMSAGVFNALVKDGKSGIAGGIFHREDIVEYESISDEIERNIKLAIDLLDEEPNFTLIFTSEASHSEYESNSHFEGVKEIKIISGDAAYTIINDYFQDCTNRD